MDRKIRAYGCTLTALALALLFGTASPAQATAITLNQWYSFGFGAMGSSFTNGSLSVLGIDPASLAAPNPAWTFTLPSSGTLIVADGFNSGDQFSITDFGALLGNTSVPTLGTNCNKDITICLNTPAMSTGEFSLSAGSYSIDGTVLASPFTGGTAFFEVTTSVPEPASLSLLATSLAGFAGFAFLRRR